MTKSNKSYREGVQMTGIERLVDIVDDGPYSGGMVHISAQKLREICEQIEREVADISGYESDVLAFVEEKGGLDELERRLIPEGMEWPRYDTGELVGFGDEYVNANGNVSTLRTIVIKDCRDRLGGGYYWKLGKGACAVVVKNGERIKRPPVLAADGEPLEKGQTVYLPDGTPLHVTGICDVTEGHQTVFGKAGNDITDSEWDAALLTHQRPVLDADGILLEAGQTVYDKDTGDRFEVTGFSDDGFVICWDIDKCESDVEILPSQLTHQRPVLAADGLPIKAGDTVWSVNDGTEYKVGGIRDILGVEFDDDTELDKAFDAQVQDMERRARALVERERGE